MEALLNAKSILKSFSFGLIAYLLTPLRETERNKIIVHESVANETEAFGFLSELVGYTKLDSEVFCLLLAVNSLYNTNGIMDPWFVIWLRAIEDEQEMQSLYNNFVLLEGVTGHRLFKKWLTELRNLDSKCRDFLANMPPEEVVRDVPSERITFLSRYPATGGLARYLVTGELYYLGVYVRAFKSNSESFDTPFDIDFKNMTNFETRSFIQ